jgi:secreted PhoX family phosphatase
MLNSRMSRRSFLGVAAAGLAATVLDWNKINAVAEKMGARLDRFKFSRIR